MPETIVTSYSEISTARQCLHKHDLAYKQRWQRPARPGGALARGTLWHQLMDTHYRTLLETQRARGPFGQGMPTPEELLAAVQPLLRGSGGEQTEDQQLIQWMYTGYLQYYGLDPDWEILAIEHPAEVWLPTHTGGRSRFKLKFKVDLIVRDRRTRNVWLVDHKSCKDLPHRKDLDLEDQFPLYTWGLRQLGKKVFGSIHAAARTHRPKWGGPDDLRQRNEQGEYLNKDGTVSKNQPTPYPLEARFARTPLSPSDIELQNIAVEAYEYAKLAWQMRRDGSWAPRSPDPDRCGWKCDYTEACIAGRKGINETEVLLASGFTQGLDPLTGQPLRH